MKFTWSTQQKAIFHWAKTSKGNLVVRARAGTGKTTTIIEAINHAPEDRILLCAFNKKIAMELAEKIRNPHAEAKTLHGVGFSYVRRYAERIRVDNTGARAEDLSRRAFRINNMSAPDVLVRLVSKLHSKGREMMPLANSGDDLIPLANAFDCIPDEEWVEDGFTLEYLCDIAYEAMELAAAEKPKTTGIDFIDMLYLPVRNSWLRPRYGLVVVDEAQDMNATQLLIAQGVCKGRMAVVGDDRQAIYSFRGADSTSIDRLKVGLEADEIPLTCTYRCGKGIVAEAQRLVPDYKAAPSNPNGTVRNLSSQLVPGEIAVGDFLLSRKNAPLVSFALAILREGKRCKIEGRDIGKGLIALIRKLAKGPAKNSMPKFLEKLERWREREVQRAEKSNDRGAEQRIEMILDRASTVLALAEGLTGVPELQTRIEDLFSDRKGTPQVTCSSIHRSKGLEAERVYVLADTLNPSIPCICGHWPGAHDGGNCALCSCSEMSHDQTRELEEENIEYVAITRAQTELVYVQGGSK